MTLLRRETAARLGLRVVLLLAPVLALLCGAVVQRPSGVVLVLVVTLAAGWAVLPESVLGTLALGTVVLWWALRVGAEVPLSALLAALLVLAAHLASVLLAYGPPGSPLGAPVVRLWARREVAVAVSAPVVWLLARAVGGQPEPPGVWVAGLASAAVVCVVAAVAVSTGRAEP